MILSKRPEIERFLKAPEHESFHDRRLWDLREKRDREAHGIPEWEELRALADVVGQYDALVFSDEIHSSLVLDPAAAHTPYGSRPGADPDLTFTVTAVSKGWNIPGLMCAQLIASGKGPGPPNPHLIPTPFPPARRPHPAPWAHQKR